MSLLYKSKGCQCAGCRHDQLCNEEKCICLIYEKNTPRTTESFSEKEFIAFETLNTHREEENHESM